MAADAAAATSVETATPFCYVNKDDMDTDLSASDEEFEDDEIIVNNE